MRGMWSVVDDNNSTIREFFGIDAYRIDRSRVSGAYSMLVFLW